MVAIWITTLVYIMYESLFFLCGKLPSNHIHFWNQNNNGYDSYWISNKLNCNFGPWKAVRHVIFLFGKLPSNHTFPWPLGFHLYQTKCAFHKNASFPRIVFTSNNIKTIRICEESHCTNYMCNLCLSPLKIVSSIQHYVIKFVCDLRQVGGFLRVLWFPPPIKLTATI
jgi:hypothetical protein